MFVLIVEKYDDYEPCKYYVDSTKLDIKGSVLDKMLDKTIKKKSFTQELYISVPEMRKKYPDSPDFIEGEHPSFTNAAIKQRLPKGQTVEKHVDFNISFE